MTDLVTDEWFGKFDDLPADLKGEVVNLVEEGGAIVGDLDAIAARLGLAHFVVLLREKVTGGLAGIGALKDPSKDYQAGSFQKAGVPLAGFREANELGYVVVDAAYKGNQLSGKLIELILRRAAPPLWATTDSETMRNGLARAGFKRAGTDWKGKRGDLSLWTLTSLGSK